MHKIHVLKIAFGPRFLRRFLRRVLRRVARSGQQKGHPTTGTNTLRFERTRMYAGAANNAGCALQALREAVARGVRHV